MMPQLKKFAFALAASGALLGVSSGAAQADVMASAVLQLNNFVFSTGGTVASGGTALSTTDFSFLTYTSTGAYNGTLPGTPGYNTSSSATPVDLPNTCVGSGCAAWSAAYGAENSFTNLTPPPGGNYSAADQLESGAPISGIAGLPLGATADNAAYAGLTTQTGLSHSQSTNNLQSSFIFQLTNPGAITAQYDINAYLNVYVTGNEMFPGFATANIQPNSLTLTDLTTGKIIWSFTPDVFGNGGVDTISLNAPLPFTLGQTLDTGGFIAFNATTPVLNNTDLYQLSGRNNVNVDVQRVPEPATLALLGIGLFGIGAFARRRGA